MIVILLGAPGSGKGTLANILKKDNYIHLSTGDMFREAISQKTPIGIKIKDIISSGSLVNDELTNQLVGFYIKNHSSEKILLDGYPRTINQAQYLEDNFKNITKKVLLLDVAEDIATKRIIGRRMCPKCGANYNIYFNPPIVPNKCNFDKETLIQRKDDNLESIKNRFSVFESQTSPLIDFYKQKNIMLTIDSNVSLNNEQSLNKIKEFLNK